MGLFQREQKRLLAQHDVPKFARARFFMALAGLRAGAGGANAHRIHGGCKGSRHPHFGRVIYVSTFLKHKPYRSLSF